MKHFYAHLPHSKGTIACKISGFFFIVCVCAAARKQRNAEFQIYKTNIRFICCARNLIMIMPSLIAWKIDWKPEESSHNDDKMSNFIFYITCKTCNEHIWCYILIIFGTCEQSIIHGLAHSIDHFINARYV